MNRKNSNIRFFEYGNCYHFSPEKKNDDDPVKAYTEELHLGLWVTGKRVEGSWAHSDEASSFYELKAYVLNIFQRLGVQNSFYVVENDDNDIFGKAIAFKGRNGKILAELGIVARKLLKGFSLDNEVFYADINWDNLMKVIKKNETLYHEISKFPAVSRDLALLLDESVQFEQVEHIARQTEKKILKSVELFDVYEGDKLPKGKKSYALNFILQDETKTFTRLGKQIAIAVKAGGPEPENNPTLRSIIATCKRENMPKDNIERAIKNAMGKDQSEYKEVTYEGYGPHGIAVFVDTLTDNTTRTVADVRSIFNKFNGTLGTTGSLSYLFDHKCVFTFKSKEGVDMDELILELIDFNVEDEYDVDEEEDTITIYGDDVKSYAQIQKFLEEQGFEDIGGEFTYVPNDLKDISAEERATIDKMVEKLEEFDDVQNVYTNMRPEEIPAED